ncbi:hypothetical protein DNTS_026775 [Danionella cerebrum]|uniref:Rab9 effector protein with kelch motifs n=1 Tax=Danionella cerebrum TaxID=2873325 RepID=A0A553N5Y3_9TELE|nr:hypothetical protein DNTS_026775 [Danionella translucida]
MALASGHWVEKETAGVPPSPRHGHAMTVAGNIAFLFGGASGDEDGPPLYLNDFYMITVLPDRVTWELMPQKGDVPSGREGHTLCVVKGKLYLFGGSSHPEAKECLPGVYCFDVVTLTWGKLLCGAVSLRSLKHCAAALRENIFVFGGIVGGALTNDLMMFSTVSMHWMPIKTTGTLPSERFNHSCAVVGEQIFLFGGCSEDGSVLKDMYTLNTVCGGQSFTAHHDKDIYLFGGTFCNADGVMSPTNEIHKLSIGENKN